MQNEAVTKSKICIKWRMNGFRINILSSTCKRRMSIRGKSAYGAKNGFNIHLLCTVCRTNACQLSLCAVVEMKFSRSVLNQNSKTNFWVGLDFWSNAQGAVAGREIFVF